MKADDSKNADPRLLKPARAAEYLDCSRSSVYDLIARGAIRAVRVGGLLRILFSEIERVANNETEQDVISKREEK